VLLSESENIKVAELLKDLSESTSYVKEDDTALVATATLI